MSHNRSLLLAIAAAVVVACGGDEEAGFSDVDAAAEANGGQSGLSGHGGDGGTSAGAAGKATTGGAAGAPSDGGPADSMTAVDSAPDATTADGAGGTAADAGAGAAGGSAGDVPDAALDGCARPIVYYADKDKDGHGSAATTVVACSPPASGTWVATATDCQDNDSRVHPGQAAYFAVAYRAASGNSSFDYDCSGSEDEDPSQNKAPANCGLLSLTLCGGSGYAETPRVGQGLSPYCGSSELRECRAALAILLCESVSQAVDEPFRCR